VLFVINMVAKVKTNSGACHICLLLVSLFVVVMLFASLIIVGVGGVSLENAVYVGTEDELYTAVNNAQTGVSVVVLDRDITLTASLVVLEGEHVMLTSNRDDGFYKLIGPSSVDTIIVETGGLLHLGGIIVTHTENGSGCGVNVRIGGTLAMSKGEIINNNRGGVVNYGNFVMSGGEISDNIIVKDKSANYFTGRFGGFGGGVLNNGNFTLNGGKIANNGASRGGGVANNGNFTMSGGVIVSNEVNTLRESTGGSGGGVYNNGTFVMSGGEISNNDALAGGGVDNIGNFNLLGGKITKNTSSIHSMGGAGVINSGNFVMSGGVISNNRVSWGYGSGVTNFGDFIFYGGQIVNNNASSSGGSGVYNAGKFTWVGGIVLNNKFNNVCDSSNVLYNAGFSLTTMAFICVCVMVGSYFMFHKREKPILT